MTAKELANKTIKGIATRRKTRQDMFLAYEKEKHSKRKDRYFKKHIGYKY
jgi:hypothetical protein